MTLCDECEGEDECPWEQCLYTNKGAEDMTTHEPQYPTDHRNKPPIRLELSLTDFQVLVAQGVTTHNYRDPSSQTVQLVLNVGITFAHMYDAIETAQEMQGQIGNQAKADTVTNKLFEVIEHMERALVSATVQIENLHNLIPDPDARLQAANAVQYSKGMLSGVEELVGQLRSIIKPEIEIETTLPTIPD